jgi:hypothetical protein
MNGEQQAHIRKPHTEPFRLSEQPWFIELLAAKGFTVSSSGIFTRGITRIEVTGTKLRADPGTGEKTWNADFQGADRSTITMMVEQILKMRPFLTEADFAKERAEKERLQKALTGIAVTIMDGADTHSGVQLRRFLWSLYNGHHLVNLWRMTCVLDSRRAAWVSEIFDGAFVGVLKEDDLKQTLLAAGEMQRWDDVQLSDETQQHLEELIDKIEALVRAIPPSRAHTELNGARERLREAQTALRRAKATTP